VNLIDIIIMTVIFIGFILGFKDGFVRKFIGLLGFALAIALGIIYSGTFGKLIEKVFHIEYYLSQIIAGVAIFILVIIISSIIKRIVHPFDKVNNLINQISGGLIGVIQILIFLSAIFYLMNVFNLPSENSKKSSIFYQKVYDIIPLTIDYISEYSPNTKKIINNYFNGKDTLK